MLLINKIAMSTASLNLNQRLSNIKNKINDNDISSITEKKNNMNNIQKKLAKSHEVTLKLVIDVSRLLQKYQEYFDKLDDQIKAIDIEFKNDDIKYLNAFADNSMSDLTNNFNKHINFLKRYYETTGLTNSNEMNRLRELENLHTTLVTDIKHLENPQTSASSVKQPTLIPPATTDVARNVTASEPIAKKFLKSIGIIGGGLKPKQKAKEKKTKERKKQSKPKPSESTKKKNAKQQKKKIVSNRKPKKKIVVK